MNGYSFGMRIFIQRDKTSPLHGATESQVRLVDLSQFRHCATPKSNMLGQNRRVSLQMRRISIAGEGVNHICCKRSALLTEMLSLK